MEKEELLKKIDERILAERSRQEATLNFNRKRNGRLTRAGFQMSMYFDMTLGEMRAIRDLVKES